MTGPRHDMMRIPVANSTESLYCRTCHHYFFHGGVARIADWVVEALAVQHMLHPEAIFNVDAEKEEYP